MRQARRLAGSERDCSPHRHAGGTPVSFLTLLLCLLPACIGQLELKEREQDGSEPSEDGDPSAAIARCGPGAQLTAGRLRRLTRVELDNTFRDLLTDDSRPASALDLEPQAGAFYNSYADLWADKAFLQKYLPVAEGVAARAVPKLEALYPCDWSSDSAEEACVGGLVGVVGEKLFRQRLSPSLAAKYIALFEKLRTEHTTNESVESLLTAMLLAPEFLYRAETAVGAQAQSGERGERAQYQLATQLAYVLWASSPDDTLLAAARDGELASDEQVAAQVERMLRDGKARAGLVQFFEQLFDFPKYASMSKDPSAHPEFDAALVEEMKRETRAFIEHVVFDGEGTLTELFDASYSFVSPRLAALYGTSVAGEGLQRVELPTDERAGLLTQAGFLAFTSSEAGTKPVKRGHFVLERLLCTELAPPPEADLALPDGVATENMTTREKFELHVERSECASCHRLLDPIGFGLEHYDAIGRYRREDNGHEVDAHGVLAGTGTQDGSFSGGPELSQRLAQSEVLHACITKQYFRYAMGRRETAGDACALEGVTKQFTNAGLDMRSLLLATVMSEPFLRRAPTSEK